MEHGTDILILCAGGAESECYAKMLSLVLSENGFSVGCGKLPEEPARLVLAEEETQKLPYIADWCAKCGIPCLLYGKNGRESETRLVRPISLRTLPALCREKMLPLSEPPKSGGEVSPALLVNPALRVASFGGTPLKLTEREFAVLALLWDRRGTPVPREEILREVWGGDGKAGSVEVYIRFLRKKLDEAFDVRLILYERGKGYLLRHGGGEDN